MKVKICSAVAALLLLQVLETACWTGMHVINGREYYVFDTALKNWTQCTDFCNSELGMAPASLETEKERVDVTDDLLVNGGNGWFWTSLVYVRDTQSWLWAGTGLALNYSLPWTGTQPDESWRPCTAATFKPFSTLMGWEDDRCNWSFFCLCEQRD